MRDKLGAHREELEVARRALDVAYERYATAIAKENRLVKQLDQTERRAGEAVAVEEREIQESDVVEFVEELGLQSFDPFPLDNRLLLSPGGREGLFTTSSTEASGSGGDSAARAFLS